MLLQSEFPPDIRLEKEIRSLILNGYDVLLLANSFTKKILPDFQFGKVIRINAPFKNRKLNYIVNFPIVFNPRFLFFVIRQSLKYKPDYLHTHDLPMAPFGFIVKKILGIKLIVDMHENYPAALKAYKKKGLMPKIFKNYKIARVIEKFSCKVADRIIVVIEENKSRITEYGIDEDKVIVISNTVDLKSFKMNYPSENLVKKYTNRFVILYTGFITFNRGLDIPIMAMPKILQSIPNALLILVGTGDGKTYLQNLTSELRINESVEFVDWPGHDLLSNYIHLADVCMIPQPSIESNNTTIPHKLFEYMSMSKRIIVSDATTLKRIISETECGVYFNSFDPDDFADKIIKIRGIKINMGENGRKAVESKYNWDNDSKKLIMLYDTIPADA
jgi:glycosyltransferase involved in cell wall biosynthesis